MFGLSHLLGIQLMPCIRNWRKYKLFRLDEDICYEQIEPLFRDTVDGDLIETHWKDPTQVVRLSRAARSNELLPATALSSRKSRQIQRPSLQCRHLVQRGRQARIMKSLMRQGWKITR